jgi:hypothetical protein
MEGYLPAGVGPAGGISMSNFMKGAALALTAAACLAASSAAAQSAAAIEGVWKTTKVEVTGANPITIDNPAPSLYIFARGHYSNVADTSRTPRVAVTFKDPANPTDAEKLMKYAEWGPFAAQAGTYEVKGGMLIRHPIVAKNVGALTPADQSSEIKLAGNTLVISTKSPAGQPAREQHVTLTRVK